MAFHSRERGGGTQPVQSQQLTAVGDVVGRSQTMKGILMSEGDDDDIDSDDEGRHDAHEGDSESDAGIGTKVSNGQIDAALCRLADLAGVPLDREVCTALWELTRMSVTPTATMAMLKSLKKLKIKQTLS